MDWAVREALAACPDSGVTMQYGFPGNGALTGLAAAKAARDGSPLRVPLLMLADDLVVLASTAEGLQQLLTALEAACQRWGLIISQSKTELMLVGGAAATACEGYGALQPERSMLICDICEAGWHCGCLGPPLAALPPDCWQCPPCSAAAGHTTTGAAANGTQPAGIKLHTRLTVFKVLVMSVVLYGCESRALTCAQQHRLDVFVKGCMRRRLGLRWRDHTSDEELFRPCGREDKPFDSVVVHWRRRLLRFLGTWGICLSHA
ncbi:hypothetical protein N2152v2_005388 [Parachlorella kessleri]